MGNKSDTVYHKGIVIIQEANKSGSRCAQHSSDILHLYTEYMFLQSSADNTFLQTAASNHFHSSDFLLFSSFRFYSINFLFFNSWAGGRDPSSFLGQLGCFTFYVDFYFTTFLARRFSFYVIQRELGTLFRRYFDFFLATFRSGNRRQLFYDIRTSSLQFFIYQGRFFFFGRAHWDWWLRFDSAQSAGTFFFLHLGWFTSMKGMAFLKGRIGLGLDGKRYHLGPDRLMTFVALFCIFFCGVF